MAVPFPIDISAGESFPRKILAVRKELFDIRFRRARFVERLPIDSDLHSNIITQYKYQSK